MPERVFYYDEEACYIGHSGISGTRYIFRIRAESLTNDKELVWKWLNDQFHESITGNLETALQKFRTIYWSVNYDLYIFTDPNQAMAFRMRWC